MRRMLMGTTGFQPVGLSWGSRQLGGDRSISHKNRRVELPRTVCTSYVEVSVCGIRLGRMSDTRVGPADLW